MRPLLLPFVDDSTLIFAAAMAALLRPLGARPLLAQIVGDGAEGLSARQLAAHLPGGPDLRLPPAAFTTPGGLPDLAAVVTSRMVPPILRMVGQGPDGAALPPLPGRPPVVAFQGGLDFTPERRFAHRRRADAVFLVPRSDIAPWHARRRAEGLPPQPVEFGHPAFLRPEPRPPRPPGGDLTFFAQAISPPTRPGRMHLLRLLAALARRDPGRRVVVKLRHLPDENRTHLHRERHDYPSLLAALPERPANLVLDAAPMAEVLPRTGLGLTCTSTAAADLVQAGVPTQVYLDYVENYFDPLMPPMRRLFAGSGLIATLPEILAGTVRPPDPAWLDDFFCPRDLGARLLATIAAL